MCSKIDGFGGTQEQYLKYLEQTVISLRYHHRLCDLPSSGVLQENAAQYRELDIITWDPQSPSIQASKRRKASLPTWKKTARTLIEATPKAKEWWHTVRDLGIHETMRNGKAASFMLDGAFETPLAITTTAASHHPVADGDENTTLLNSITAYAQTAMRRGATASLAVMLANFQKFLVLSSCAVLCETGIPRERVYEVVKICVGNVSEEYCQRTLRTAVFLNELIDTLNANGWDNRASELLLIWNRPPTSYYALARSPKDSLEYLNMTLSNPQFASNVQGETDWTPFFVPSLVHSILQKKVHVARISFILKYKHAHILEEPETSRGINPWEFFNPFWIPETSES